MNKLQINTKSVIWPSVKLAQNVLCFTTTVEGGVSNVPFAGLNLGAHVGDNNDSVSQNREILYRFIRDDLGVQNIRPLKWLNQQHTTNVSNYDVYEGGSCDGVYTSELFTPLAIMTADCMPIVIYCHVTNKLACIHVGWRGLLDNMIEQTLKQFGNESMLSVWIGPSISAEKFEISEDVIPLFHHYQAYLTRLSANKARVNLPHIARAKLLQANIQHIQISDVCTYSDPRCFSHRRAQHKGDKHTGRLATIALLSA